MGTGANIKDYEGGSVNNKGGLMTQLEARLQALEPERFEAFLDWIETEQWASQPLPLVRFKGDKVKSSIAISGLLLDEAKHEAQTHGFRGGISTLIEYLLWDYLGKPSNLIETEPRPKTNRRLRTTKEPLFSLGELLINGHSTKKQSS